MTSTHSETAFVQPRRMLRPQEAANSPTSPDWLARVQRRLRTEVGEDVYSSWFARMEVDGEIQFRPQALAQHLHMFHSARKLGACLHPLQKIG